MTTQRLSRSAASWLGRVTFGTTPELVQAFHTSAATDRERWEKFITEQLKEPHPRDENTEKKIKSLELQTLTKSLPALWAEHTLSAREMRAASKEKNAEMQKKERKMARKERRELALEPIFEWEAYTWVCRVYSRWQIYERMVDFWHDHFNIYAHEQRTAPGTLILSRDVIRPGALGNFRSLLGQVCRNPAMLYYLDNAYNQSGNPNENFARELFELHTLGAENYLGTIDREQVQKNSRGEVVGYVDGDIYEAARAFTGWRVADGTSGIEKDSGEFHYHEPWHDRFQKIVLGQKIPEHQAPMKDGDDVLQMLCSHPGTAKHLMRKLARRFIEDVPSNSLVDRLADFWLARKDSPTQIRDTLLELLRSKEFLEAPGQKFKRPSDFLTSLLRVVTTDFIPSEKFLQTTQRCGHRLFAWKTPDGPPDTAAPWQSPQSLIDRWKAAQQIIKNEIPGCVVDLMTSRGETSLSPEQLVQSLTARMFATEPDSSLLKTLASAAAGGRRSDAPLPDDLKSERIRLIAELCALSPDFQVRS